MPARASAPWTTKDSRSRFVDIDAFDPPYYCRGVVRYKDVRVGEYTNGKMELKGDANKLEGRYSRLME